MGTTYSNRKEYFRAYAKKHSVKRKAFSKEYHFRLRNSILEMLGKSCIRCGFDDVRALQIDHVNGNGHIQRKEKKGKFVYKIILEEILAGSKDYQVLCANCNWIKKNENNELPYRSKVL